MYKCYENKEKQHGEFFFRACQMRLNFIDWACDRKSLRTTLLGLAKSICKLHCQKED